MSIIDNVRIKQYRDKEEPVGKREFEVGCSVPLGTMVYNTDGEELIFVRYRVRSDSRIYKDRAGKNYEITGLELAMFDRPVAIRIDE